MNALVCDSVLEESRSEHSTFSCMLNQILGSRKRIFKTTVQGFPVECSSLPHPDSLLRALLGDQLASHIGGR